MSNFHTLKFNIWDSTGTVAELIKAWQPLNCRTEKDYEDSLYSHLRNALPGIVVTPQYAFGRARTDLVVGDKVAIEIKLNLQDTSEFHRLLGQILQFKKWKGRFLVLLIGSSDPHLRDELQKQIGEMDWVASSSIFGDQRVQILDKRL